MALSVTLALLPFMMFDKFLLGSAPWQDAQLLVYRVNPAAAVGTAGAVVLQTAAGEAWALHAPLVQAKVASPVVGAVVSDSNALAPEAVAAEVALHVLPLAVQLTVLAAQATGALHETPVGAAHTPLEQAKLAAPVVGLAVSDKTAVAPETVEAAVALHTFVPTLQLRAPVHGAAATGTAQVAEVAAPQVPLVQANVAAPVAGAVVSDSSALPPEAVATDVAPQVAAPTVQLSAEAVQATWAAMGLP